MKIKPIYIILGVFVLLFLIIGTVDNIKYSIEIKKEKNLREEEFERYKQKILNEYLEAVRKNQLKADSISSIYNQDYNYTIPINVYLDNYSAYNYFLCDFEHFIADVSYYGLANKDSTRGFIFSLHQPNKLIDIHILRGYDGYNGYGDWYKYNVKY